METGMGSEVEHSLPEVRASLRIDFERECEKFALRVPSQTEREELIRSTS